MSQYLKFGIKLKFDKKTILPEPITTNKKNPNKTGPTGNLSSFF
jgi:hypothetical protein